MNPQRKSLRPALSAFFACVIAACSPVVDALEIAYEGFNYAPGLLAGKGDSTPWPATGQLWTNVSGADAIVDTVGLTYPGLLTSGLSMETDLGNNGVYRNLGQTFAATGNVYWVSALVRMQVTVLNTYAGISLFEGSTERIFFGKRNTSENWGVERFGSGGANSTVATGTDQTALLVIKLDGVSTTKSVSLYVNPTSLGGAEPATPSASFTLTDAQFLFGFNRFRVQTGTNQMLDADELRFGTSFASVTPVPEPSSLILVGIASALIVETRRRRKARQPRTG
jgi:hypothetical protein